MMWRLRRDCQNQNDEIERPLICKTEPEWEETRVSIGGEKAHEVLGPKLVPRHIFRIEAKGMEYLFASVQYGRQIVRFPPLLLRRQLLVKPRHFLPLARGDHLTQHSTMLKTDELHEWFGHSFDFKVHR